MNIQSTTSRRLVIGLAVGAASLSLAACGGSSSSSSCPCGPLVSSPEIRSGCVGRVRAGWP